MTNPDVTKILEGMPEPLSLDKDVFKYRGFLYGDFGVGKTDLGIHIADTLGDKICLVYNDSGWSTILKYPEIKKKVTAYPNTGLKTIKDILVLREAKVSPYCDFDVLQWDTVSTAGNLALRSLVRTRSFPKDQYAPDLEARPHYRLLELAFRELVDRLNKTDLHIIYTAHFRFPSEKDIEQGKVAVRPNMPEASYKVFGAESNMIGHMYKDESGGERYIQLSGTRMVTAKCQIPNIPERTYKVNEIVPLLTEWIQSEYLGRKQS